jgi:hypothetical protein
VRVVGVANGGLSIDCGLGQKRRKGFLNLGNKRGRRFLMRKLKMVEGGGK